MSRKKWMLAAIGLIAVTIYLAARRYLTLDTAVAYEVQLRSWIDLHPGRAFLLGLIAYTALSFVPGTTGKSLVFGWLFGFWLALLQVNVALTTAALGSFFLSRYFLRDAVESRFGFYIQRFDAVLARGGGFYVATLRMLHAPFTFVNYALGATSIPWTTFWWSSQLGMLPGNIVFVLAGAQLPSLEVISREGTRAVFSPRLTACFLLMALFPLIIQQAVRYWKRKRGFPSDSDVS